MSTSTTNVLYLDHTAKLGGGELALLSLTAHLNTGQYRPVVVLASDGPLVVRLRAAGVETHVLEMRADIVDARKGRLGINSLLKIGQAASLLSYAVKLSRFAKEINAGVIHTNSLKSDIYGAFCGMFAGIPVIWHVRDQITPEYLPSVVAKVFRFLSSLLPKAVIANSQSTLNSLQLRKGKKSAVAYSGVDECVFNRETVRPFNTQAPVVTLVGRIAEWKGQHILVDAATMLVNEFPSLSFQIVGAPLFGEETYEAKLKSTIAIKGLERHVHMLGFRTDIVELIEQSDIIVHTSCIGEPFGQVVVQGMAAGKPVVATNGGALPEIVVPGITGLLTDMGNSLQLSDAIRRLINDPDLASRMGSAGKERARLLFNITGTVESVTRIYDDVIGKARRNHRGNPVLNS